MRKNEKEAFFNQKLVGAIAKYTLVAIAALNIFESSLVSNNVFADSTIDNIAIKIDRLKQLDKRWIEIDLSDQHLFAWDGNKQIFTAVVSTGKAKTPTYPGVYTIQRKYSSDRMRGADYDLPDVPNVLYFDRGYALHGANWHSNFGMPMSHGCVNLPVGNAEWLFNWAEIDTTVVIHQ